MPPHEQRVFPMTPYKPPKSPNCKPRTHDEPPQAPNPRVATIRLRATKKTQDSLPVKSDIGMSLSIQHIVDTCMMPECGPFIADTLIYPSYIYLIEPKVSGTMQHALEENLFEP